MNHSNYNEQINLILKSNPLLAPGKIGVILTADSLYKDIPPDVMAFREMYVHMNPDTIINNNDRITFLKIAHSKEPMHVIKHRLNSYLNIKFNDIMHPISYEENMVTFKFYSTQASALIDDFLKTAAYPDTIIDALSEKKVVKECNDFYNMLELYKNASDLRTKYELIRKLGLIVLIVWLNRSMYVEELDERMNYALSAIRKGLFYKDKKKKQFYFWIGPYNQIRYTADRKASEEHYRKDMEERRCLALKTYPIQSCDFNPFVTSNGTEILHIEVRNKLKKGDSINYNSFVEKIIRKNLEFPSLVRDIIGIKLVVNSEEDIEKLITEIEGVLGGSSTRKKEKNSYHRFGRKSLSEFSSKEYFVWKAIYEIILPHTSISRIEKLIKLTKGDKAVSAELKSRLNFYLKNPQDFLVEVQLQDIKSYLQSRAHGSPTQHNVLKMNQIRTNSFYKLFPKEIYEEVIAEMKQKLLCNGSEH